MHVTCFLLGCQNLLQWFGTITVLQPCLLLLRNVCLSVVNVAQGFRKTSRKRQNPTWFFFSAINSSISLNNTRILKKKTTFWKHGEYIMLKGMMSLWRDGFPQSLFLYCVFFALSQVSVVYKMFCWKFFIHFLLI